ncbi:hypothetical protein QR680_005390 [Steinernema hermaphroditum]|uniref:peptidylprolyl isomerase n=1 Tax=Steinernema hermaphroditum TaxID=289476 RepID=A0AA39LV88_9BILA|nr:hypothetical protein QR680_005390 [Steinernema hermaphroditum]
MTATNEAPEIDVSPAQDGGVLKTVLQEGTGEDTPVTGDVVYVHYVGRLENGEEFDSSIKTNTPFHFTLGEGQVIKGWELVAPTMKAGEKALVKIGPKYGYGAAGRPPTIPPNSTLIFEMELLRWTGEDISPDFDGSIYKRVIAPGEKHKNPSDFARVKVHAVGEYNGQAFLDEDLDYILGEGSIYNLPDGVDKALRRFTKGEKARVTLSTPYNYGTEPPKGLEVEIPPNAEIVFVLFLKDFEAKHLWEMDEVEKLAEAAEHKEKGNMFLKANNYKVALDKYRAVISMLETDRNVSDERKVEWRNMRVTCYTNSALVELKRGQAAEAIRLCQKVLEQDANNVKGVYRMAEALSMRKDYEEAIKNYQRVIELDPSNKAALQKMNECAQKLEAQKNAEKKRYAKLFKKMRTEDEDVSKVVTDVVDAAAVQ